MYQYSIQKRVFLVLWKSYEICINNYSYVYIKYVGLSQWYKLYLNNDPLILVFSLQSSWKEVHKCLHEINVAH